NAAAWTAVDAAEEQEAEALVINGTAPGAMARAAAETGVPFLHVSTDYVFDGSGERPWRPDDTPNPLSAYGRTKLAGEEAVKGAGGRYAILRTAWVVSAHGSNFIKTMLRLGAERDALRVVDDQIGGPTPAAGLAEGLIAAGAAMLEGQGGGLHHLSGAPEVSWAEVAETIMARAGLSCAIERIPSSEYPLPAPRPMNSRLDCAS
ncbi:MAG: dTDP-4-dehydrorhamnose reductase, partial [Pseudomonadota bacterium]